MLQLTVLSLAELAQHANAWDELWRKSDTCLPSSRAAGIELWQRIFAPTADLFAIVVVQDGQFVAGLPMFRDKSTWLPGVYRLPVNCTVNAGDLLIDSDCDVEAATQAIARYIARLPGTIAAFEGIQIDTDRWQRLIGALRAEGRVMHISPGREIGLVDILHDWDAYTRSWSGNHRSSIKRACGKLEAAGQMQVVRLRDATDDELHSTLETCFAIENKGWKGQGGTSILSTPWLREYYHEEARMLRDLGALDLWLLKLNERIIAFEYCQYSKGTCFSHKISFDPDFEKYSPGKVLRCIQLEQYHQDPAAEVMDTLGVLCEAKAKWVTRTYKSSRSFVAIGGHGSNFLLQGYKTVRGLMHRRRPTMAENAVLPGAARYLETADSRQSVITC